MNWKINLHSVTIQQCEELEDKFRVASEAGYSGIDLMYTDLEKFVGKGHEVGDVVSLTKKYKLTISHLGFLADWQFENGIPLVCKLDRDEDDAEAKSMEQTRKFFKDCSAIGCRCAFAIPAINKVGSIDEAIKNYGKLCDIGAQEGINVAFEFVGFACQMKDLKIAWKIVKESNRPNGGILLDTFHFYRGASRMEDLKNIPKDKILIVHVNDAKEKNREGLTDLDRIMPGQGIIPLRDILSVLKHKGYEGYLSVEIFNEDYWADDPLKVAIQAREATENLFKSI